MRLDGVVPGSGVCPLEQPVTGFSRCPETWSLRSRDGRFPKIDVDDLSPHDYLLLDVVFLLIDRIIQTISSALADELSLAGDAPAVEEIEAGLADEAGVVLPVEAVLEGAGPVGQLVLRLADSAKSLLQFHASFNGAHSSLQFVVGQTLHACASIGFQAAVLHGLAAVSVRDVETTLTSETSVVVVRLAAGDGALVVLEQEGLKALLAGMVGFLHLAAQQVVVLALSEDEGVFNVAFDAVAFTSVVHAELGTFGAGSIHFPEAVCAVEAGLCVSLETTGHHGGDE